MDTETPPPIVLKNPPSSGAILRGAVASLRKRGGSAAALADPVPLLRPGVTLEAARIYAYAKLCGFTSPQGVPLTYPHLLAFPLHMAIMLRASFPFPVIGLVHLENSITQHRRLDSGDRLDVLVRLGAWIAHEKGQAFTLATAITRGDSLVWESTSTYLRLGVRDPLGAPYAGIAGEGARFATLRRWAMKSDIGRRYAALSGDANPIHTSGLGARLFGFPRPIAHGMWMKARALAALLPPAPVARAEARVSFKTPALLPGGLTLLIAPESDPTLFELRDGRDQKPHLRGVVSAAC
jgi:hypothetical protein